MHGFKVVGVTRSACAIYELEVGQEIAVVCQWSVVETLTGSSANSIITRHQKKYLFYHLCNLTQLISLSTSNFLLLIDWQKVQRSSSLSILPGTAKSKYCHSVAAEEQLLLTTLLRDRLAARFRLIEHVVNHSRDRVVVILHTDTLFLVLIGRRQSWFRDNSIYIVNSPYGDEQTIKYTYNIQSTPTFIHLPIPTVEFSVIKLFDVLVEKRNYHSVRTVGPQRPSSISPVLSNTDPV